MCFNKTGQKRARVLRICTQDSRLLLTEGFAIKSHEKDMRYEKLKKKKNH
jgi:hypothetical protein